MALRPEAIMSMENSIQNAATRKIMNNGNGDAGPEPKNSLEDVPYLSSKKMQEWNEFLKYVEDKNLKGKPELDKEDMGNKLFQEWKKQNPNKSINIDDVPSVRKTYLALRDENIEGFKSGKSYYDTPQGRLSGPKADYSSFMRNITLNEESANPNYIGRYMTQTKFPAVIGRVKEQESKKILSEQAGPLYRPGMKDVELKQAIKTAESKIPLKNP